jgi:uncharacterized membrane protein YidH (DUF202 family)
MRWTRSLATVAAGVAVATLAPTAVATAATAPTRGCVASVSNPRPVQNSTVVVTVRGVAGGAAVTSVAHFKSTNTTHRFGAAANGTGSTAYPISRATHGYRVVVSVTAAKGSARWSCSTAFTTR